MKHSARRYIVVGPAWIGDTVMAHSLFQAIKQAHPDSALDVLAPDWTRVLLNRMPEVDGVIASPFKHGELALSERKRLGVGLRDKNYSHAIVLPGSFKSALTPYWSRAKVRTGFRGEMRYGLLNDIRALDKKTLPLNVQRFVALGREKNSALPTKDMCPLPTLFADSGKAKQTQTLLGIAQHDKPVLGLCPGAEYGPAKQWPAEQFAELAKMYIRDGGVVWLFGSAKDQTHCAYIKAAVGKDFANSCTDVSGKTNLDQAIDLLSITESVVSNDSGLMHVACALGKRVIGLFGSTSPGFTPPLGERAESIWLRLECSPCFKRECPLEHLNCLKQISPKRVAKLLQRQI
ncbi:MAG: lipopolysaccharide heptosyltransferase II [Arenicellales bacterium WSBS_2016_MAG_OTU3]